MSLSKEAVLAQVVKVLTETFEIEPSRITPASRLYEDLDIDSIDAIDLLVRMKPMLGKPLQPEAFKAARTVQDVVDALHALTQA